MTRDMKTICVRSTRTSYVNLYFTIFSCVIALSLHKKYFATLFEKHKENIVTSLLQSEWRVGSNLKYKDLDVNGVNVS